MAGTERRAGGTIAQLAALAGRTLAQSRRMLAGVLLVLVAFQLALVLQASSYQEARTFDQLAAIVPGYIQRGLGSAFAVFASFEGMVLMGFYHPIVMLMLAVVAISFASEPAHEVEQSQVDLVLARPVPRRTVLLRSAIVMAASVAALVLVEWAAFAAAVRLFAPPRSPVPGSGTVALLAVHLTAVAWCFGALSLAIASRARRRVTAVGAASIAAVALFMIDLLSISWAPARSIAWLSPFHYYSWTGIVTGAAPPLANLAVLWTATAALVVLADWNFQRRDL
jgi:ABC-type transport system involved in multi-copper enzyme maturation permease subunit